jgi:ribokinase
MLMTRNGTRVDVPALPVKVISTHGAGDCFCGALAARLASGDEIEFACRFASSAAARFVSGQ